MNLLVVGGRIVSDKVIRDGAVAIEGGRIIDVGGRDELKRRYPRYERIDATDHLVIPGLINAHTHAAMTLLRGYADEVSLSGFLDKCWPVEAHMEGWEIEVGAELAAAESLLGGVTTMNSMYHYFPDHNEAVALSRVGMRGVIGHACFSGRKDYDKGMVEDSVKRWHGRDGDRIRICVCPHAPYTVGPEDFKEFEALRLELYERYGGGKPILSCVHVAEARDEVDQIRRAFGIDVSETGILGYLDGLGILSKEFVASHVIHVGDRDMEVMASRGVKVCHDPVSNFKLSTGLSPVPEMLRRGITVSLGTDGPASNNTLDLFETMKFASLIHKFAQKDPAILPADQVFRMATQGGAETLNWKDLGRIAPNHLADLVLVRLKSPHLTPLYDEYSHLVYAARASDVSTVIVNGELVVERGRLLRVDVEELMDKVNKVRDDLLDKVKERGGETP